MLRAEIVSVGTELLFGEITDTNAAFLAAELVARGVTLNRKTVIGDHLPTLTQVLQDALERADLILLGGGLGPTDDDLTREAVAAALGETPSEDAELLAWLEGLYAARGRDMPRSNRKQTWLIPSAQALANPVGTAPGWYVQPRGPRYAGKVIVALPGPPREMKKMWAEQVLPRLPLPDHAILHTTIHTQGIGESNLVEVLGDLTRGQNPSLGTYARKTGVDVRVSASAPTHDEAQALLHPALSQVRERLQRWTWGEDGDTLAGALQPTLGDRTLGVIEAGSAGHLCTLLAGQANQSILHDAAITENHARLITLGLTPVTLRDRGLVSEQAALELAAGAREHLDADIGLSVVVSTTGDNAGTAHAAIVTPDTHRATTINWPGHPDQIRERAAVAALALAYRTLRPGGWQG
ncbi:CinA family nicotinamide mononucleotide deamidase-related protein [Deinococcus fonticola]|uniref:CinA family nicotinamide mononucleotide deamidase-related protein n=1 Tax=Deinococcus fonticola TaxID=2528713 RepID=UPI001075370F|nr:CinA family nicotinamide mononucleotide deamidase-related protein [Deinococcus fonticola]